MFVSGDGSLEVEGFDGTNEMGGFTGGKIEEVEGVLDSDFEPDGIREVLVLFDLLWIDLFLLTCNPLIPVIVSW